jgi:2-dehydro-3-deoxyphosphogluconate aldolase/(4S)-4-hydroxy-2-oxoglutarate aldolase
MTPSEAAAAHAYGADAVKIFPAGALGSAYVEAIKAPLSHIKLLAVGGVNENNAGEFIRAGAMGVGIGGNLTRESLIRAGAFDQIRDVARACAKAVRAV